MTAERYLLVKITDDEPVPASANYYAGRIRAFLASRRTSASAIDVASVVQLAGEGSDHCAAEALRNGLALL